MRWGLVPGWADSAASRMSTFNARIESAATKPTFRQVLGRRHCLVPASGYYEWVGTGRAKQPWYITPANDPLMFFAGLWDRWQSQSGESLLSFTILTTAATGELAEMHERRPIICPATHAAEWLRAGNAAAAQLLAHERETALRWHPVGRAVGDVREDHPELIRPVGGILVDARERI